LVPTLKMQFPSWLTWYKKPSYVDVNEYANRIREKAEKVHERSRSMTQSRPSSPRSSSESSRRSCDVPSKLSLDRILRNKPCTLNTPRLMPLADFGNRQPNVLI